MAAKIQTVTEQIYQEIRKEILSKTMPPGEKLTIKMLNERYGVSSSPIREALARLQQDGLIDYKPNVGMSVIQLTNRDMDELFEFMSELDVIALRAAMKSGRSEELVAKLSTLQQQAAAFLEDTEMWNKLTDAFHLALYEFADNSRLTDAADKVRSQFTIFTHSYREDKRARESILAGHKCILDAISSGDTAHAEQLMREHVYLSRDKVLETLEKENAAVTSANVVP